MTFLSILIALLVERIAPQLTDIRQFYWLRDYSQWMNDAFGIEKLGGWIAASILLLPVLVVIWILTGLFEDALFGLFELLFAVVVLFFCLGPRELDGQIDGYIDTIEVGDSQQRFNQASRFGQISPSMELSAQVSEVCKAIFVQANVRIYAVLFWFVLLGPIAAVMYRVMEQLMTQNYLGQSLQSVRSLLRTLMGWIDWIPAHLTLCAYMVSGSFEDGLQAFRRGNISAIDAYEQNSEILQNVGFQSINQHEAHDASEAVAMVRKTRGLVLRSLVVWLLFLLLISFID